MIKGTVLKTQTYTSGNDCSLNVAIEPEYKSVIMDYDKEKVFIMTEDEYKTLMENGKDLDVLQAKSLAKKVFEEALKIIE